MQRSPLTRILWSNPRPPRLLHYALLLAMLAGGVGLVWFPRIGPWLGRSPQPHPADAIVVLGGDYPVRILYGAELYRQGLAAEIWHTGDTPVSRGRVSHGELARRLSVQNGVAPEAIHLLFSTSTWSDAEAIKRLAAERQITSILVVTSWYHNRRAICTIQHQMDDSDIAVYYASPPDTVTNSANWWRHWRGWRDVMSEQGKLLVYGLRYGMPIWRC